MKLTTIIGLSALAVAGLSVFFLCNGGVCGGFSNSFRFLQTGDNAAYTSNEYQDLLNDPKFAKVDVYGVSGFIDSRAECKNYKNAAQSASLYRNNYTNNQVWESKIEAIMIYQEAKRHGCNID